MEKFPPPDVSPWLPATPDVYLTGERSSDNAKRITAVLKERGVCVIQTGADSAFQKNLLVESRLLWDSSQFSEAAKALPAVGAASRGAAVEHKTRDDKIVWLTPDWVRGAGRRCKALQVLNDQLTDFCSGLRPFLQADLGIEIDKRTSGMLSCYAGDSVPGARYDLHVDNPFETLMQVPDDKRRLTILYYISEPGWDLAADGGALEVCLSGAAATPSTGAEARRAPRMRVAPESGTMVVFLAHRMYHAVLPMRSKRRRFALSTWIQCP